MSHYILGRILGWIFFITIVKPMRFIYGNRKSITNLTPELTKKIQAGSIIIVSNHIKPRNKFLKLISMPYDAYIIRGIFKKIGIYSTALTSYDSGKRKKNQQLDQAKKNKEFLVKGIVESMDLIPLNRNEKDETTSEELIKRLKNKNVGIGIFPEGTWFRGFRKKRKVYGGAAVFAKKYKLNILPVFLDAYNLNLETKLNIGELISFELPSLEINEKIRSEFNKLYSELNTLKK